MCLCIDAFFRCILLNHERLRNEEAIVMPSPLCYITKDIFEKKAHNLHRYLETDK